MGLTMTSTPGIKCLVWRTDACFEETLADFVDVRVGAYAEYIAISTRILIHKPKELLWEEAAGTPEVGRTSNRQRAMTMRFLQTWITATQAVYLVDGFAPGRSILWHAGASSISIAWIHLPLADKVSAVYIIAGS